jgi:two-component system cell cycle response regulator DivK
MAGELILIVEDNERNRKLVRDVLRFKGYQTIEVETGEESLRLARDRRPSLILMDPAPRDRWDRGAPAAAG